MTYSFTWYSTVRDDPMKALAKQTHMFCCAIVCMFLFLLGIALVALCDILSPINCSKTEYCKYFWPKNPQHLESKFG